MRRSIGVKLVTLMFVLLSLNGLLQVLQRATGGNTDPIALTLFQLASGVTAMAAAVGAWQGSRWSSVASLAYGVVTAAMLALLPHLLRLDEDAKMGIWSGATIVLLVSVAAGWYLHRQHDAPPATSAAPDASSRAS